MLGVPEGPRPCPTHCCNFQARDPSVLGPRGHPTGLSSESAAPTLPPAHHTPAALDLARQLGVAQPLGWHTS